MSMSTIILTDRQQNSSVKSQNIEKESVRIKFRPQEVIK